MTAEKRPSFNTQAIEFIKGFGLVEQAAFDPRTDPLYEKFMSKWNSSPDKPETLVGRLRKILSIMRGTQ